MHPSDGSGIRPDGPVLWIYVHEKTYEENFGAATNVGNTTCTFTSSVVTNGCVGTYMPDDRVVFVDRQTWDEDAVLSVAEVEIIQMEHGGPVSFTAALKSWVYGGLSARTLHTFSLLLLRPLFHFGHFPVWKSRRYSGSIY